MVARFSDPKALAFAYTELVGMGISQISLRAHVDEVADSSQALQEHHSFLQQLREWVTSPHPDNAGGSADLDRPRSPLFKGSGGLLEINAPGQDTAIVQVLIHHEGTLVD